MLLAACLLGALAQAAVAADIMVDNKAYEETARMVLQDGQLVIHLRPKSVAAPQPAVAQGAAQPETAPPAAQAMQKVPSKFAVVPPLNKEAAEAIASNMKSQDSPTMNALGLTTGPMTTPSTPREYGAALGRAVDASGKVKEGIALQASPASLLMPNSLKGGRAYADSRAMQVWARTSVELATAKSEDTRIGQQIGASVSTGFIDDSDPRLYWSLLSRCTSDIFQHIGEPGVPYPADLVEAELAKARECYKTKWAEKSRDLWKAPRWYAGYTKAWYTGDTEKFSAAQSGPSMLWTTYSRGFDRLNPSGARFKTLLEFSAARKQHLLVDDPADATRLVGESRTDASVRLRFSRSLWSGFTTFGLARARTAGVLSENVRQFGYGVEYKVNDSMWLVLSSITERGFVSGDKRSLLSTGLRFGQSDKDLIAAPPQAGK